MNPRPGSARNEEMRALLATTAAALEPTGDGLVAFDAECRCLFWNAAMEQITGVTEGETLGRKLFDLFPFLLQSGEDRQFQSALAGERVSSRDRPFFIADTGRGGLYDAFYSPLRLDGVAGGLVIVRDITGRRRAEQLIRETEGRFKNMADASPVLLWMSGTDALCDFFNQTWLDFTGRTMEEEWGVGWAEGIHPEDFQRSMDLYLQCFNERRPFEMEYRLRRHDGAYRWILDRGVPRRAPDGTFAGYIGSCVDITDRRRLEVELREAVHARDDFLMAAAHELRTPLTPIRLSVDMLLRAARNSTNGTRSVPRLEALSQHVDRQVQLVEQLLDVSRLVHASVEVERARADLAEIARDAAHEVQEMGRRAGSLLRVSAPSAVWGQFDRVLVTQLVRQLLSNAFKYGQGRPVDLEIAEIEDTGWIIVRDRGIGISEEDQSRIFERFERAVPVQQFGGFGVGLWIARRLAQAMEGTIRVESRLGEGATFTVEIPRHAGEPAEAPRAPEHRLSPEAPT